MGIGYSHESQLLHKLYNHYKKRHNIPIVGGSENDPRNVVGGYSALEDYGNSVYSKAKEELIRGLAKDVSGILGVQNVETGPIDAVIKKFTEVLPKPGTGKGTLKADPAKHAKLCSLLAKAINKRYEMKVIDENAEPHEICQKVAELMYSLFTGLHSEFLNVAGDVSRIVKNLEVLQGIVDSANQKIMNDLAKSNDGAVSSVAETTKDVYKKISDEIRRQHVLLSNIINSSIGPVGSSLITLLADNKDFSGLVEGLKKTTGTQYFGDRLAYLLSGISSIAHSANLVDKALKKIGMSVADYKNVKGLTDLRKKVYDAIAKKKPSTGEMHKLMVAADILYRNDLAHDDIAKYLEKKNDSVRGGSYGGDELDPVDPSFADMVDEATWEDTSSTPFSGRLQSYRKSIGKQIRDQRKYRNMLFSDFNLQIKSQYASLISIIAKISQKVGGEIPISDKLERFIRLLNNFSAIQPDRKNLHIALSSYRNDATSNFIKYQYMDYLEIIKDEAEYMGNSPGGMYFREIAGVISKLIHIIDDFNLNFTKTLSEFHMDVGPSGQKKKLGSRDDNISGLREYGGEHDNQHGHQHGHHHRHKKHNRGIHDKHDSDTTDSFLEQSSKEIEEENNELASELVEDEEIKGGNEIESSINSNGNVKLGGESTVEEILGGIIRGFSDYDFKHFKTLKKSIR